MATIVRIGTIILESLVEVVTYALGGLTRAGERQFRRQLLECGSQWIGEAFPDPSRVTPSEVVHYARIQGHPAMREEAAVEILAWMTKQEVARERKPVFA